MFQQFRVSRGSALTTFYPSPRLRYLPFDGDAYTFGGGKGSRAGSGRIFAKMPFKF
jgi:hypothetical protein